MNKNKVTKISLLLSIYCIFEILRKLKTVIARNNMSKL